MQLLAKYLINVVGMVLLTACATSEPPLADSNDQLPMYGDSNRQADSGLRAADDKLATELIQRYDSPQAAARNLLDQGVRYFKSGEYAMAMKSFNQAWLIDPNSPEPFWGFAVVYDDQGKSCMAKAMIDRALSLNLSKPAELADAGRIYTYCAVSDATLSADDRRRYFDGAVQSLSIRFMGDCPLLAGQLCRCLEDDQEAAGIGRNSGRGFLELVAGEDAGAAALRSVVKWIHG